MIFNGRALALNWQKKLAAKVGATAPTLAVILVGDDPASRSFVKIKQKFGKAIGVEVTVREYDDPVTIEELIKSITQLNRDVNCGGIVVQLPLPAGVKVDQVIAAIDPAKDVDALGLESPFTPPTARAVAEILKIAKVDLAGRAALVVGAGRLVGRPVATWLAQAGAQVKLADEATKDLATQCLAAEIIIAGAGRPNLIKPAMIKPGAILIDFGTSGAGDKLAGDFDPACADQAALFTPTPGGTGPVTVAMLFANLLGA